MQEDAEERFRAWEEERWRKETEFEERRRREEIAHELQVLLLTGHRSQFELAPPHAGPSHAGLPNRMYSFSLPSGTLPHNRDSPLSPLYEDSNHP